MICQGEGTQFLQWIIRAHQQPRPVRGLLKTAAQRLPHRQDFCALEGEAVVFLVFSNFKGRPRRFRFLILKNDYVFAVSIRAILWNAFDMKILVTGGAGYLGSVLVPQLLAAGHSVTVLDSFMFRQTSLADCCASDAFDVIRGDCRDERLLAGLVAKHDVFIPLAALVGAPLCDRDALGAISINRDAVRLLCRLASPSQRILMPVTNSGHGIGQPGVSCTEESPLKPISLYGTSKVEAELAVLERENSISFRLATVFGMAPRMRLDLLVNDFVYRAVNDRALVIFEGHFKRNYIHIRDVARVFLHGLENFETMRGRAYNVGLEDANLTKLELCAVIQKHLPKFVYLEAPIGEDPDKRDYIVSNQRILSTGWAPEWTLDRGICELIKGYTILKNSVYANV